MELLRRRGLHIGAVLILIVVLGATAYPSGLVDQLQAAVTAIRAGRPELALPALTNAIALEPELQDLQLRAAEGALAGEQLEQAVSLLSDLPQGDPRLECLQLDAAIKTGLISTALDLLPGTQCPVQSEQLFQEVDRLTEDGDYDAAIEMLSTLLGAVPVTADASQKLGKLVALSDPDGALSHLRLAIDLDRESTGFARELFETIESSRSENSPAFTLAQVGQAFAREESWSMAAAAFENALAQDPTYTEARAYYGLALDRSGGNGLPQLELAAAEAPQAPLPHVLLGKHWLINGEPARAVEAYEQAALLAPEDPLIAIDLGAAYAASGALPEAKLAYQYATELAPDDPALWALLAQFSLDYEVELAELALPAARRSALLQSGDAAALDRLGYTHFLLRNWALAERFLLESIRSDGKLPSAHYHLGLLRLSAGDVRGGKAALATAVALDPDGRYGNLALRSLENLDQ